MWSGSRFSWDCELSLTFVACLNKLTELLKCKTCLRAEVKSADHSMNCLFCFVHFQVWYIMIFFVRTNRMLSCVVQDSAAALAPAQSFSSGPEGTSAAEPAGLQRKLHPSD